MVEHPIPADTVFEEQRDFLICFLFLLKHTDKTIIHQWLKRENVAFIKRFFYIINFCIQTFQFLDRDVWEKRMIENSEVKSSAMTKATIEDFYSAGGVPKRTTYRQRTKEGGLASPEQSRAFKKSTIKRKNSSAPEVSNINYNEKMVNQTKLSRIFIYLLMNTLKKTKGIKFK